MRIEELKLWESFHAVATQGSFSKAAKVMKSGIPQTSKRIAKLEELLGVALFHRSTRVVSLTDEGKALLPKVSMVLEDLSTIENEFEAKQEIAGTLRIASVPFVAHRLLLPIITQFQATYPKVKIDLELSEGMVNLIESNIDLAIRIDDEPSDSSMIYRKLGSNDLILCASAKYLAKHKAAIRVPADLKHHQMLMLDVHGDCQFINGSMKLKDLASSKKVSCDNGWFLTQLALEGGGVLVRAKHDVQSYLDKGTLVQVLKKHPLENFGQIFAVIPSRRYLAPRVRAFLNLVIEKSKSWA